MGSQDWQPLAVPRAEQQDSILLGRFGKWETGSDGKAPLFTFLAFDCDSHRAPASHSGL